MRSRSGRAGRKRGEEVYFDQKIIEQSLMFNK
jgi:hypothetical protein